MRGLKLNDYEVYLYSYLVAPYVGAWIETAQTFAAIEAGKVAPYVGAWIETEILSGKRLILLSHPTWVRGLKH